MSGERIQTFSELAEAVRFLAAALTERDDAALRRACREELPAEWVLKRLRERNRETPLPQLYVGREFPADAESFKLGGHDRELGHIHVDFVRSDAGWEIQRIWMCR